MQSPGAVSKLSPFSPPRRGWLGAGVSVALHAVLLGAVWLWAPHRPVPSMPVGGDPLLEVSWMPDPEPRPPTRQPQPQPQPSPLPTPPVPPTVAPAPRLVAQAARTSEAVAPQPPAPASTPAAPSTPESAAIPESPAPSVAIASAPVSAPPAPPPLAEPRTLAITRVSYRQAPVLSYPPAARRAQEEGRAHVRVLVDAQGQPVQLQLAQASGHARLDAAALDSAGQIRFHPYTENGQPRPFWVVVPFVFELEN